MQVTQSRIRSRFIPAGAVAAALFVCGFVVMGAPRTATATVPTASLVRVVKQDVAGNVIETHVYGSASHEDQVGDVYYDADWPAGSRPAMVVVHGGWWHNGTRAAARRAAEKFYAAGFVVFNIDYRRAADQQRSDGTVNPGDRWPAQRIDVELAVRFLKASAASFGTAADRIALYGFSAGGHVVTVAAGYYKSVTAAVSVGGLLQPHRTADIAMSGTWGSDSATPTIVKSFGYMTSALGCSYEPTWVNCGAKWRSFKPETYFAANAPAIYAIKGALDSVEPASALTSVEYWLDRAGQEHRTILVAGRGHTEDLILGSSVDDIARWNALVSWIKARTT